jgi:hypothetical protein
MWLLISASSVPLAFLSNFYLLRLQYIPAFSPTTYMILQFVGYCTCFVLFFLFWCMAVYFYDDKVRGKGGLSYGGSYLRMKGLSRPVVWIGLICGLIRALALMVAPLLLSMLFSFLISGETSEATLQVMSYVYFYLTFIVADLLIVFIVLVPQMLCLEGGRTVEVVLRASYNLIKERYRNALILLIIPEVIAATFYLGAVILADQLRLGMELTPLLLAFVALLEGARTAFVAAAFNRFYYHVLEEEKKKRKAKSRKQAAKKKAARKKGKKR